jgi:hypothetical protein
LGSQRRGKPDADCRKKEVPVHKVWENRSQKGGLEDGQACQEKEGILKMAHNPLAKKSCQPVNAGKPIMKGGKKK